jgi:hypothetical protein
LINADCRDSNGMRVRLWKKELQDLADELGIAISVHCRRSSSPEERTEKQDCERNTEKRWLARHAAAVGRLRPVYLGHDLFVCQPIVAAIHDAGGNFIITCKPSSHKTIAEYLHGAEVQEHRQTVCHRGKRNTDVCRWLSGVALRVTDRCRHSQLVLHQDP